MTRRILRLLLVGALLAPAVVAGQENQVSEIVGVRVGFAGRYKVGLWTPVEVRLRGDRQLVSGEVRLTVPDGDGVPSRVRVPVGNGETSVPMYARFGRIDSRLAVELRAGGRVVDRRVFQTAPTADATHFRPAIAATRQVIIVVAGDPSDTEDAGDPLGVHDAVELLRQDADQRTVVVWLRDCGQLPTQWYGYEGVAAVVLSTGRPQFDWARQLTTRQAAALEEWITTGGKLVWTAGSQAEAALAEGSPLRRFVPGRFESVFPLRDTRALEAYVGSSKQVPPPADGERLELPIARLADARGIVEAWEADLPLVVRAPRGFGQIVFLAADLGRGPLSQWADRPLLVSKLLDLATDRHEESERRSTGLPYGFNDLAGQLRSALDQFTDVRVVPFWVVAALVFVYVVLIGPLDYFFLRKVARRMQWTWVTFPLVVVVFSLGAYLLVDWLKGDQIRVNQVDLVDVDVASGRLRGTSWINVFSPRTESFDLSLRPKSPGGKAPRDARVLFAWLGLPGGALGGMDPQAATPVLWTERYDFSPPLDAIRGVPIQTRSTKGFTARWNAQAEPGLRADLVERNRVPCGTIANTLDVPLGECVLAYQRWAYRLETLKPGVSVRLGPMTRRSELNTWLTGWQPVRRGAKDVFRLESTPYDQSSVDVPYILRVMMFYEAAGGRRYTGLSGGYQGHVDFSDLLETGLAILVARGPPGCRGAELLRDEKPMTVREDEHVTFYRFVLPVKRAGSRPQPAPDRLPTAP